MIDAMSERREYRYYTRLVKRLPMYSYYHKKRLVVARQMAWREPLQGALADYFFACWHEMDFDGALMLEELSGILPEHVLLGFRQYLYQGSHILPVNHLATRFSVLVSPSMNVPRHKLFVGKDDAKGLSAKVSAALIDADPSDIALIQAEYFAHCLACQDKMGFMMTWFSLAKLGWVFDEAWLDCKNRLEN